MKHYDLYRMFIILMIVPFATVAVGQELNLIKHSDRWSFVSQRNELLSVNYIDSSEIYQGAPTLVIAGGGKEIANGNWQTTVDVQPSTFYEFKAYFRDENVEEHYRSILARILWFDSDGNQIGTTEYPTTLQQMTVDGWNEIQQIYKVPEAVSKARIELVYRWDENGLVRFGNVSLTQTNDHKPRLVRLATIHHRPSGSSGASQNLDEFAGYIDQAAQQHADIVCLPEGVTLVGTSSNYVSASEPIPGPTSKFLGEIANRYDMYVVAGILEKEGDAVFNTAILIDRDGNVAGKYRKVSLPREEIEGGVTPGSSFPVFETDFGKIGMMICWDVSFPEAARALAFQGAEVIMMPIWGGHLTLAKARALENQIFLVSSSYDMKSAVFNQEGEIIGEASKENPVVVVEVDLNQTKYWPWLGDFKNRIRREMPPVESQILD